MLTASNNRDGDLTLVDVPMVVADGIGAPDPNPRSSVNWCFI